MNELIVEVIQATSVWILGAIATSILCALIYPLYRRLNRDCTPENAALSQLSYALLPLIAAIFITVLVMTPSLFQMLVPVHCHTGNCDAHRPVLNAVLPVKIGVVILSAFLLVAGILVLNTLLMTKKRLLTLHHLSKAEHANYRVVDTADPLAWCAGIFKPQVYLSTGLLSRLDSQEMAVVLAHEHCHAVRFDNLRTALLYWATVFWPSSFRHLLNADFRTSTEQACDRAAARVLNDSALVSHVISAIDRSPSQRSESTSRHNFYGVSRLSRLQGLEKLSTNSRSVLAGWLVIVTIWLLQILLLTGLAHMTIESIF